MEIKETKSIFGSLSKKFKSFTLKRPKTVSANNLASEINLDNQNAQTLQALDSVPSKAQKLTINDIVIIPEQSNPKIENIDDDSSKIAQKNFGNRISNKNIDDSEILPESIVDLDKLNQDLCVKGYSSNKKIDTQKLSFDFRSDATLSNRSETGLIFKVEKSNKITHDLSINEAFEQKKNPKFANKATSIQNNLNELEQIDDTGGFRAIKSFAEFLPKRPGYVNHQAENTYIREAQKNSIGNTTDFSTSLPNEKCFQGSVKKAFDTTLMANIATSGSTPEKVSNKRLLIMILLLILFLILSFVILIVAASIITYPFRNIHSLWIGNFFHGFFLGILNLIFFKVMIRGVIQKFNQTTKTICTISKEEFVRKYNGYDVILISGSLAIISGLIMVAIATYQIIFLNNSFVFIGIEISILILNGFGLWLLNFTKNYFEIRKSKANKSQNFFSIAIYKNFMTDLNTARDVLSERNTIVDLAVESSRSHTPALTQKDEAIEKVILKKPFELANSSKVFFSQLLLIIVFIQYSTATGLVIAFNTMGQQHKVFPIVVILISHSIIGYLFVKVLEHVDKLANLNMTVYIYYLNAAFRAMFSRAILLNIESMELVWTIIIYKICYKLAIYIMFGLRIDFWKVFFLEKIKEILKLQPEHKYKVDLSAITTNRPLSDTNKSKNNSILKLPRVEKERVQYVVRRFAMKFFIIQTNDILYSIGSLGLFACYQHLQMDYSRSKLTINVIDIYLKATWIETAIDFGLLFIISVFWFYSRIYKSLQVDEVIKKFFKQLCVDYVCMTFTLLISFLFWIKMMMDV